MATATKDLHSEVGTSGVLDRVVHRGHLPPWHRPVRPLQEVDLVGPPPLTEEVVEALVESLPDPPRPPVHTILPPPPEWVKANRRRMFWSGELLVPHLERGLAYLRSWAASGWAAKRLVGRAACAIPLITSKLEAVVDHGDGTATDYGVVSRHVVTTAGKTFLAACFTNANEPETMKYHAYGTGTTAAAVGDTALVAEMTTQYNPDNTRPTGSQSASTNTYTTAATFTPDSGGTIAVTEHGILSQAATGGGTLLDRNVFSAVNLVAAVSNGDSLTTTYTFTIN